MSRRTTWLVLGVLAAGAAIAVGTLAGDRSPITIAVVYNDSGGMKWLDAPAHDGLRLAVAQINDTGGVLGRPIETVDADGTTDGSTMTGLVDDLVQNGDPVAIVGVNDPIHAVSPIRGALRRAEGGLITFGQSELALAVSRVTGGLPFVTSGSTLTTLPDLTEDVFPVAASQDEGVAAIADYARSELGAATVFVLGNTGNEYTNRLAESFRTHWEGTGGEIAGSVTYETGQLDIASQIEELQAGDDVPDAVFLASMPNDGGYLVRQIRDAGLEMPILFANVVDDRYIAAMAGEMDEVYMSTQGSLVTDDERIVEFIDAYEQAYGHAPESPTALLGFDAMGLIADAIERSGTTDRSQLATALASTDHFEGLSGTLSYSPDGHPIKTITVVGYRNGTPEPLSYRR